jgi:hypothetical protein
MSDADFDTLWRDKLEPALAGKEVERRRAVRGFVMALSVGAALTAAAFMVIASLGDDVGGLIMVPIVIMIISGAVGYGGLRKLSREIKQTLLDAIADAYGLRYAEKPYAPARFSEFRGHSLLPHYDRKSFEDHFEGAIHGADFELYEAHLETKHRTKNGTRWVTRFRGVLIRINFPRNVEGVTIIVRDKGWFNAFEGLTRGMGDRKLKRIGLVDPKFEDVFQVYGDDQVMARYMLTPSFMERLLELETALSGKKVRAAFDQHLGGGELLIAAETGNRFEPGSMFKPLADPERFKTLVEELRLVTEIIDLLVEPATDRLGDTPPA